jgi:hypothetical protein
VVVSPHTQSRAQGATERKLDEVLPSSPSADNSGITFEKAPDDELKSATARGRAGTPAVTQALSRLSDTRELDTSTLG